MLFTKNNAKEILSLFRDFWSEKSAVVQLFRDDMAAKSRGSRSSVFWNFVMPVVPVGFYVLLSSVNVFPAVENMDRLTFVSIGVMLWLLFSGLIMNVMNGLEPSIKALESNRLSILSNLVVRLTTILFDTLVRMAFVVIVIVLFSNDELQFNLMFVPVLLLAMACCFGLGLFLAVLNIAFGDLAKFIAIILQYGIFVSGVIFPLSKMGWIAAYASFNPLYLAIDAIRSYLVLGVYQAAPGFYIPIALGITLLIWALAIVCVLKNTLRGRL